MSDFTHSLAIVIGINAYANGIPRLTTAVNDAARLAGLLHDAHGYETTLLAGTVDGQPVTRERLASIFTEELPARLGEDDRLLVYFAGHGVALDGDDGPRGYLVPQDARPGDSASMLAMTDLHAWLSALPCRHMLAILDCCFAGAFRWAATRHMGALPDVIYRERYDRYLRSPAWQVLTSAAYDQKALDVLGGSVLGRRETGEPHSPFALALFDALGGAGDLIPKGQGDGVITATELYLYLRQQVEVQAEAQASHEQTPGLWPLNKHRKGEYIFLAPGHPLNLPPAPDLTEELNPYRGLKSYDQQHAPLFFGREDEIKELTALVDQQSFLAVLGASGTGKSSLVKAGVLPRLQVESGRLKVEGAPEAVNRSDDFSRSAPGTATEVATTNETYRVLPPMRPTDQPVRALETLLRAELAEDLAGLRDLPGLDLAHIVARWAAAHPGQRLVLTIDQFEELVTLCRDDAERERFLALLAAAVEQQPAAFRLIITLRTDFEPQFTQADSPLAGAWQAGRYIVPPMDIEDLRQVIEGPASVRVLYFDPPELVDDLIKEVIQTPGALPLLSFTLSELCVKCIQSGRDDRALAGADYQALGGVVGSLRNRATEEYEHLPDNAHRLTMQRVMLRMVAVEGGELARRRVALSELEYPTAEENERVKTVLDRLVEARLLVRGTADNPDGTKGEAYVEPAHDALVLAWDKLLRWKKEAEEYLPLQRRLAQATTEWRKAIPGARSGLLWDDDPRLPQAEETLWPTGGKQKGLAGRMRWARQVLVPKTDAPKDTKWVNGAELAFVQASVRARTRFWRRTVSTSSIVMVVLVSLTALAMILRQSALYESRRATVGELAALSKASLATDPEMSIWLASEAVATAEPEFMFEPEDTLRQALVTSRLVSRYESNVGNLRAAAISQNQRRYALANEDGKLWVHDTFSNTLLATLDTGNDAWVYDLDFSPGKSEFLGATGCIRHASGQGCVQGFLKVWKTANWEMVSVQGMDETGWNLDFAPAGHIIAVQNGSSRIDAWNANTGALMWSRAISEVQDLKFSPSSDYLAVLARPNTVCLWDDDLGNDLSQWRAFETDENVQSLAFSHRGILVVTGTRGSISLWDVSNPASVRLLNRQTNHEGRVHDAAFSSNDACLATIGSDDHKAVVWEQVNQKHVILSGHTNSLISLSFLDFAEMENSRLEPCGNRNLATIDTQGVYLVWNVGASQEYETLVAHSAPIEDIEFSPDGKYLATASDDGSAQIWTVEPFRFFGQIQLGARVEDVDFSSDSHFLATASWNGTVRIWDVATKTEQFHPLEKHVGHVNAVSFRPMHENQIVTGGDDGKVFLWTIQPGGDASTSELLASPYPIYRIEFSQNGRRLITASDNGLSSIIDLESGQTITLEAGGDAVYHAVLSSDGRYAFTAGSDGAIRLWDAVASMNPYRQQTEAHLIATHQGRAYSVSLDSAGRLLASAGQDRKVFVFNVNLETGQVGRKAILTGSEVLLNSIRFSPDGRFLATADESGLIRLHLVDIDELHKFAVERRLTKRQLTPEECQIYPIPTACANPTPTRRQP